MSSGVGSRRPGGVFPIDHGYTDLSMPVLLAAERAARAVPTSATERAVNLKGAGLPAARREAIHSYHE
jgi:hypothetical protein